MTSFKKGLPFQTGVPSKITPINPLFQDGPEITDRILTLHPEGKEGVNIEREKYNQMKTAILDVLRDSGPLPFIEVREQVRAKLRSKFTGSISWYYTTIKLDLEARGLIERIPGSSPQMIRLA